MVTLTRRQADILALVAAGRTAKQIGSALCLSHRTVECHLRRAYRRLGIRGQTGRRSACRAVALFARGEIGVER